MNKEQEQIRKKSPVNIRNKKAAFDYFFVDNFTAGIVYGLISYGITKEDIENGPDEKTWDKLIACAEMFSADCCKSIDNSVSWDFGKNNKIKTTI